MEKLTLKEIVGYLPYKLNARLSQQGIFNLDSEYPNENAHKVGFIDNFYFNQGELSGSLKISEKFSFDFEEGDIEILLYPLEMLTKTIVHNGVEIIPIVELAKINYPDNRDYFLEVNENLCLVEIIGITNKTFGFNQLGNFWCLESSNSIGVNNQLKLFEFLHELHFDLYGLLERNLAIDKSTLNSK